MTAERKRDLIHVSILITFGLALVVPFFVFAALAGN